MRYNVFISWKMRKCLEIEADSEDEAETIAGEMYYNNCFEVDEVQDCMANSLNIDKIEMIKEVF